MSEVLDRLLYSIELDSKKFKTGAAQAENAIYDLGDVATKTFQQQIGRELARSLDPNISKSQLNKINSEIRRFGTTAQKTFQQSFGRRQAKEIFKPFVDESQSFTARIKGAFTEAFDIKKIAIGAAAGIGVAEISRSLVNAGKAAISFASDFEFGLAKVRSIAGEGFDINAVTKDLERIAVTVPQDLNTLTEALFFTITSGIRDVGDATRVLEVGAKAAVAGVTDATTAIDGLTTVLNAYQLDSRQAVRVSDILFRTVDQGKVTFEDLSKAIGEVANPAKLLGIDFSEVGAAIATMTKAGVDVQTTTTALKNLFVSIAAAKPSALKVAQELGINLSKAGIEAAGGFVPFIAQIAKLTQAQPDLLKGIAGNLRSFRALSIIAGTNADEFQRLGVQFKDVEFIAGSTEAVFQTLTETARNQYKLFKDSLSVAVKSFGDAVLRDVVPVLIQLNEIMSNDTAIDKYIKRLKELGASADQLEVADKINDLAKAQQTLKNTEQSFNELKSSAGFLANFLRGQGVDLSFIAYFDDVFQSARGFTDELIKQTQTAQGLVSAQKETDDILARSRERLVQLTELRQLDNEVGNLAIPQLEEAQRLDDARLAILKQVIEQRLIELKAKKTLGTITEDELKLIEKQQSQLEQVNAATDELKQTEEEIQKERERGRKEAEKLQKAIELASVDGLERGLIRIRQQTEKTKEDFADFPNVVALATKKASVDIENLISKSLEPIKDKAGFDARLEEIKEKAGDVKRIFADFPEIAADAIVVSAKLVDRSYSELLKSTSIVSEKIRDSFKNSKIKLSPTNFEVEPIRTESFDIDFSGRVRLKVNNLFKPVTDAVDLFADQLEIAGFKLDNDFAEFVSVLDENSGKIARNFVKLTDALQAFAAGQGSVFGVLAPLGGLIKDIFGGSSAQKQRELEQERARAEQKRIQREQQAARAAQDFARSIADLQNALESTSLANLELQISDFVDLIGTRLREGILSAEQIAQVATVAAEIAQATGKAPSFADLANALRERATNDPAFLGLADVFKQALPDRVRRDLFDFLVKLGYSLEELENFGKQAETTLASVLNNLSLRFDTFNIDDPTQQLFLFRDAMAELGAKDLPSTVEGLQQFAKDAFDALTNPAVDLADFLRSYGLEGLGRDEFETFLTELNGFLDALGTEASTKFEDVLERLRLRFDTFNIDDPTDQLSEFLDAMADIGIVLPRATGELQQFAQDAFDALAAPAEDFAAFIEKYGLGELSRTELQGILEAINGFIDNIGGVTESGFSELLSNLALRFRLFQIDEPLAQLQLFREELEKFGAINIPDTAEGIQAFIQDAFEALTNPDVDLKASLESYGLENLGKQEFEQFLETLSDFVRDIGTVATFGFSDVLQRLQLEFELLDVNDPIEKLNRFRAGLEKIGVAGLPETIEEIDAFVKAAFEALRLPADELANFLRQYGLDVLGKSEFEQFLRTLEGFVDDINKQADEIETVGPVGLSKTFVQQITLGQANTLINEISTMRVVVTGIFSLLRDVFSGNDLFENFPEFEFSPQDIADASTLNSSLIVSELAKLNDTTLEQNTSLGAIQSMVGDVVFYLSELLSSQSALKSSFDNSFALDGAQSVEIPENFLDNSFDSQAVVSAIENLQTVNSAQISIFSEFQSSLSSIRELLFQGIDIQKALNSIISDNKVEIDLTPFEVQGLALENIFSRNTEMAGTLQSILARSVENKTTLSLIGGQGFEAISQLGALSKLSNSQFAVLQEANRQRGQMIVQLQTMNSKMDDLILTTGRGVSVSSVKAENPYDARNIKILSKSIGG